MKTLVTSAALVLLLVGASLAGCATTQTQATSTPMSNVQVVTVTLTDSGVTASQTTFRPGVLCHFIVTNLGTRPHQFWLQQGSVHHTIGPEQE